jgi:hypothetical protein
VVVDEENPRVVSRCLGDVAHYGRGRGILVASYKKVIVTVRVNADASLHDANQRSIRFPVIAPPVSAATPSPYPGMLIRVPSGITVGSTATIPGPTGRPVAVVPFRQ